MSKANFHLFICCCHHLCQVAMTKHAFKVFSMPEGGTGGSGGREGRMGLGLGCVGGHAQGRHQMFEP